MILKSRNVKLNWIGSIQIMSHPRPDWTDNRYQVNRRRIFFSNPCRGRGYITSTPKSAEFLKKTQKWLKNERDSCIPEPKNGERPYLAVPEPTFWGLFFRLFFAILLHHLHLTHPDFIFCLYFYFYYTPSNSTPGMSALNYTSLTNPFY